jgi:ABC-type multidrug transport system ATPase subunit
MQVRKIEVDNFKSLVEFDLELGHFTCLIGLNGSGKSTVVQAIDFLARLFQGYVSAWLEKRQWKATDLVTSIPRKGKESDSKPIRKSNIDLSVDLLDGDTTVRWEGSFNRTLLRCTQESLTINGVQVLQVDRGHYRLVFSIPYDLHKIRESRDAQEDRIRFSYQGSIISQLKDDELPETVLPFKTFMRQTKSLDLLSPQYLRQRTRQSGGELGLGGERLSAFVYELSGEQRRRLEEQLRRCYRNLTRIHTSSLRSGWKQIEVGEVFGDYRISTEARHINDGMLRLMAILAVTPTENQFLLFEEIENGINPELVDFLLDLLANAKQQILVTTHSPMILNYLDDDIARSGVQYIYKTAEGYSRSIPFFSIPSMSHKLRIMGPGEAFADTELTRLQEEIDEVMTDRKERGDAISG